MPETKPRSPKQLTAAQVLAQVKGLPLDEQLAVFNSLKADIEEAKKQAQERIELINSSVK